MKLKRRPGRRAVTVALLAALAVVAGACSSTGGKQAEQTQATSQRFKVALVTHQPPGDTFWDIVRKGAQAAADKDNIELLYSSDPDGPKQATLVQSAIDSKVDAIAVTLAHPDNLADVVQKAKAAGIPLVALNSGFTQWQDLGAMMYFGQDEELAGYAGGQRLSQEGAKHVICIAPEQGNVSIDARCRGAKKGFSGNLEVLYVNGTDLPSVETTVAAKLKQDPSIDYLLAQGAPVTLTSIKSVEGANNPPKIVAFDLNPQVAEAIKGGQVQWTIDQQPYVQGFLAIDSLWLYLTNGNTVGGGKEVLTGPAFVSKDNIDQVAEYAEGGTR